MNEFRLIPRTGKAKSRVAAVRKVCPEWDGSSWRLVNRLHRVAFTTEPGPWLLLTPDVEEDGEVEHFASRWVHATRDADFDVQPLVPPVQA